jgi:hypothetical protein
MSVFNYRSMSRQFRRCKVHLANAFRQVILREIWTCNVDENK